MYSFLVREQNLIRQDPQIIIRELEDFLLERNQYYLKRSITLEAIGDKDHKEAVRKLEIYLNFFLKL